MRQRNVVTDVPSELGEYPPPGTVLIRAVMPDLTSGPSRQNISLGVRSLEGGFCTCETFSELRSRL
jgi:hypothetical protein